MMTPSERCQSTGLMEYEDTPKKIWAKPFAANQSMRTAVNHQSPTYMHALVRTASVHRDDMGDGLIGQRIAMPLCLSFSMLVRLRLDKLLLCHSSFDRLGCHGSCSRVYAPEEPPDMATQA